MDTFEEIGRKAADFLAGRLTSDTAVELNSLPGAGNDAGMFVLTVTTPKGSAEYAFERFISRAPTA